MAVDKEVVGLMTMNNMNYSTYNLPEIFKIFCFLFIGIFFVLHIDLDFRSVR